MGQAHNYSQLKNQHNNNEQGTCNKKQRKKQEKKVFVFLVFCNEDGEVAIT